MLITVDLNDPADRARARDLLAAADAEPVETPNTELPAHVVAYVHEHAPLKRRNAMLGILAREVAERGAHLLIGGEFNKTVRACLPGTETAYLAVRPPQGGLWLTESDADESPYAYYQVPNTYPVRLSFDGPETIEEFHRLAALAYERRAKALA